MASPTPQSEKDATSTIYPESYYTRHHLYSYTGAVDCLRVLWPIFTPISEILKVNDATDPRSATRPYFDSQTQTFFHPISGAYVTHPPVSTMSFEIGCLLGYQGLVEDTCGCIEAHDLDECQCRDRNIAPEPLIVSNPRGVNIGDVINVISAANPFFIEQKRAILIAESFYKNLREWQAEDDECDIKPLPEKSQFYLSKLLPIRFTFEEHTGNGATLDELRGTMAEWAMRIKDTLSLQLEKFLKELSVGLMLLQ